MNIRPLSLTVSIACSLAAINVFAQEKSIKRPDLPAAVQKTASEQSAGATVVGFSEEKEDGQTNYEMSMKFNGHEKNVVMDPNGNVVEVEEEVVMDSLPADIKAGLLAKAGKGKITKVESLTKHGKIVAYEAQLLTGSKRSEIQVGPDGKPLDHEE